MKKISDNTIHHFNLTARILHWFMAFAILIMLFIGVGMTTSLTWRPWLIDIHRPLGMAILVLAILRLINRIYYPAPSLPATIPRLQKIIAHISHWLLYLLMIILPLLGWATLSAGGWPINLTPDLSLPSIAPYNTTLYALLRTAHGIFAWLLFAIILGHISAALLHALIYRDGVFSSMVCGDSKKTSPTVHLNNEKDKL
ncbi:cytochrome B [Acinetobacter sp. ANC 4558]|uniref:cytochrome b n=1 Tax=Acinetobacter sp. ANC 4558 TaxID=1977876 RepID=UPI000A32EAC6|nr:cytochrome b [Acinetobacter sp. ANC 4558]OTG86462.1 cytochrome B [Acinetobacter sp. ANC 4558]